MNEKALILSSSPHAHGKNSTRRIMLDVLIALCPAVIAGTWYFGFRALAVVLLSAAGCVFFEWAYRKLLKLDCTCLDGSAAVTGVLLALVCPPTIPYWVVLVGDLFAIVVVKQLFGGIGKNFMNPALAGRAFLMLSWAALMTTWVAPGSNPGLLSGNGPMPDAVSSATPLALMHQGLAPDVSLLDMLLGRTGGCIGETCAAALLLGGVYLVIRRVISPRIPLCFLGTVALLGLIFPQGGLSGLEWAAASVLSGGVMLGAIFMATDYATTPVTRLGQIVFGVGCGLITVFIRRFGAYPEGTSYAILVMNVCVVLLDKLGRPRRFRTAKGGEAK